MVLVIILYFFMGRSWVGFIFFRSGTFFRPSQTYKLSLAGKYNTYRPVIFLNGAHL